MTDELDLRIKQYRATPALLAAADANVFTEARKCSHAAMVAASAGVICSHPRELRQLPAPAFVPPGKDELDYLSSDDVPLKTVLPLPPGMNSLEKLAQGVDE